MTLSLRKLNQDHGSSIIEMAILMPAFALLIFAMFEFSMAMTSYLGTMYAVRNATRYASVRSSISPSPASITQLQNMVKATAFVPPSSSVAVGYVTYVGTSNGNVPGNLVAVSCQYTQTISVPFYSNSFTISTIDYRLIGH